jgi:hypothetical protein
VAIEAIVVDSGKEARERVLAMLPEGAEVNVDRVPGCEGLGVGHQRQANAGSASARVTLGSASIRYGVGLGLPGSTGGAAASG